ncbi:hypothetical protein [Hasllibacter sp. MH4015]|uniref:hypothetical protein n=1 Tax=Hasllibacter sp. MH4015 TaxID=2854029 RepID=UPI001CD39F03|nr:hypothetical protein [Hasllibacter sp. MH4015]
MFNIKIFGIGLMAIGGLLAAIAIAVTVSSFRPPFTDAQLRTNYATWGQGQGLEVYSRQMETVIARENSQRMTCAIVPGGSQCPMSGNVALLTYLGIVLAGVGLVIVIASPKRDPA